MATESAVLNKGTGKSSIMSIEYNNNYVLGGSKRSTQPLSKPHQGLHLDNRMDPIIVEQTDVEIPQHTIEELDQTQLSIGEKKVQQDQEAPGEEAKGSESSTNEFDPNILEFKSNQINIKNPYVGHPMTLPSRFDQLNSWQKLAQQPPTQITSSPSQKKKNQASKVLNIESLKQKTNQMVKSQGLGHSKYMTNCAVVSKTGKKPPSAFINARSPNQNKLIQKHNERTVSALGTNEEAVHKQLEQRKNSSSTYVALLDKVFLTNSKKPSQPSGQKRPLSKPKSSSKTAKLQGKSPAKGFMSPVGHFKLQNVKEVQLDSRNKTTLKTESSYASLQNVNSKKQLPLANQSVVSMAYNNSKRGRNENFEQVAHRSTFSQASAGSKLKKKQDQTDLSKPQIILQTKQNQEEEKLSVNHDKFELLLAKNTFSLPTKSSLNKQTRPDFTNQSKSSKGSQKPDNTSVSSNKFIRKKNDDRQIKTRMKSPVDLNLVSKNGTNLFKNNRQEVKSTTTKASNAKNHARLIGKTTDAATSYNHRSLQNRQLLVTKSIISTNTKRSTASIPEQTESKKIIKTSSKKERLKFLSPQNHSRFDTQRKDSCPKSTVIEQESSQLRKSKSKDKSRHGSRIRLRAQLVSPVPAGGGLILKSKQLLKNLFEFQFFPIVQQILKKEANEQLIMMLETKDELVHFEDKFKSKDFLFNGKYARDSELPLDVKSHDLKIKIAYRSLSLKLKMENVEEVLTQMGFIRQGENSDIQDKLDFMRLWEILYKTQVKYDCNKKRKGKRKSFPEVYRKTISEHEEDVKSLSSDTESDISDDYFKSSKVINETKSLLYGDQTITVRVLEKALLNVVGIWKTRPKLFREFQQLKDNYEVHYQQEYKQQSMNSIIKHHITEINRQRIEETRNQKRLAQESGQTLQINTGGYFGAPDKPIRQEPEILVRYDENNPNRINDQFKNFLRQSDSVTKARPSSNLKQTSSNKSPKKKSGMKSKAQKDLQRLQEIIQIQNNEIMSITDALSINLPTSFSLKSISAQNQDSDMAMLNNLTMKSESSPPKFDLQQSQTPDMKTAVLNFEKKQRELALMQFNKDQQMPQTDTKVSLPNSQRGPDRQIDFDQELESLRSNENELNDAAFNNESPIGTVIENPDQPNNLNLSLFENISYSKLHQKKQEFMKKMEEQIINARPTDPKKRRLKSMDFNGEEKQSIFRPTQDHLFQLEPRMPTPMHENYQTHNSDDDEPVSDEDQHAETGGTSQYTVTTEKKQFNQVIEQQNKTQDRELPKHLQLHIQTLEDITKLEIQINEVQNELTRQNEAKASKKSMTPMQVRFNLPENGEIKEEIREDSMDEESEENDFINKVLRTSDCNDLLHLDSDELLFDNNLIEEEEKRCENAILSKAERDHSRLSKKETIMAELKSEAESFIKMQNIRASDRGSSQKKEVPAEIHNMISPTLFVMDDEPRGDGLNFQLRNEQAAAHESERSASIQSAGRKFKSRIPGKSLEPREQASQNEQVPPVQLVRLNSELKESTSTQKGSQSSRVAKIEVLVSPINQELSLRRSGGKQSSKVMNHEQKVDPKKLKNPAQTQNNLPPKKSRASTLKFVKPKPSDAKQEIISQGTDLFPLQKEKQTTPQHGKIHQRDESHATKSPPRKTGSDHLEISDNSSIFKNNISEHYARMMAQQQPLPVKTFSSPHKIIKFEIYIDEVIGTQVIEICDKAQISENVETFALKFDITNQAKISKLKKYLKQQWKQRHQE